MSDKISYGIGDYVNVKATTFGLNWAKETFGENFPSATVAGKIIKINTDKGFQVYFPSDGSTFGCWDTDFVNQSTSLDVSSSSSKNTKTIISPSSSSSPTNTSTLCQLQTSSSTTPTSSYQLSTSTSPSLILSQSASKVTKFSSRCNT